jgi:hypothetical protein
MSLIRTRRERKQFGIAGIRRPPPISQLLLLLIIVIGIVYWMTRLGG